LPPVYHDDDISAFDCGSEIARRALNRSEPTILAFDIHPTALEFQRASNRQYRGAAA
jgi:hypothetical protein